MLALITYDKNITSGKLYLKLTIRITPAGRKLVSPLHAGHEVPLHRQPISGCMGKT